MRVLVCGGRTWGWAHWDATFEAKRLALKQRQQTFDVLDKIDMVIGVDLLIHGDARGADRVAQLWAERLRIAIQPFPANWHDLGKAAGPIRNTQMLDEGRPDLVVAFPGNIGTSDMLGKAFDRDGVETLDMGGLLNENSLFDSWRS